MAEEPIQSSSKFAAEFKDMKESEFYEKPKESKEKIFQQTNCVLVNPKQKENPALKNITNVPWEISDIVPDYVMGPTTCALFLSIRYHNLHPDYIHQRLKELGRNYLLRVLLVLVDVSEPYAALKEITKIAVLADCTLLLAWSFADAGKYIETYKIYENKPADKIMEKQDVDPHKKIADSLSSIRSINKTDAMTLLAKFGSLKNIVDATEEQLALCPGMGYQKASRLHQVLHQKFAKEKS